MRAPAEQAKVLFDALDRNKENSYVTQHDHSDGEWKTCCLGIIVFNKTSKAV